MTGLLILLVVILIVVVVQFELRAKLSFNAILNGGTITVKFLGIKIINYYFTFKKGYIHLQSKKNQKFIPLEFTTEGIKQVSKIDDFIFSKIFFKRVDVFINVGIKEKAYETAMITGFLNVILSNLLIYLKNSKSEVIETIKIYSEFDKSVFNIALKCKISISLIDLIWCVIENIAYKQIYKNSIENNEQTKKQR